MSNVPFLGPDFASQKGRFVVAMSPEGVHARQMVVNLMNSGEYTLENSPCLCGASDDRLLATVDRYRIPHRTVICMHCGLVRTDPRLDEKSYTHFYTHHYRDLYQRPGNSIQEVFNSQKNNAERRFLFITNNMALSEKSRVLELGCGAGWNLLEFHQKNHFVKGYDYNSDYLTTGRTNGLDLSFGGIEDALASNERYDLVILSHVVEHLLDPIGLMGRVRTLLNDRGVVFVEVPSVLNVRRKLMKYFQSAHTYSFTPETLNFVMTNAAYESIAVSNLIESLWKPTAKDAVESASLRVEKGVAGRVLRSLWVGKILNHLGL